jgi:O-antigen/teichoic acid export membrane protein
MTALPRPSLVKSSRWVFLRVVASHLIQFAGNIALARYLGPAGLGVVGLVNSAAPSPP